jgi:selenocysteine lyase/cysteine desulfurase
MVDQTVAKWSSSSSLEKSNQLRRFFSLTNDFTFLNHGAFGGALEPLSNEAHRWRLECEKQPLRFFDRDLFALVALSLQKMATIINCSATDLLPLPNVTTGLNAITQSISLQAGDEIMVLSLTYGSTKKIVKDWALRTGASVKTVHLPLPLTSNEDVLERIGSAVSDRTKVIIIDQITSNTAVHLPVRAIAASCKSINPQMKVVVDAAHALFSQDVSIHRKDHSDTPVLHEDFEHVDYWLTNAHKWFSTPKGAALLWVNPRTVHALHPAVVSHGYSPSYETNPSATTLARGKFLSGFSWDGCRDYAAFLTLPSAIYLWDKLEAVVSSEFHGGYRSDSPHSPARWTHLRQHHICHTLDHAERIFMEKWQLQAEDFPCPFDMRRTNPIRLVSAFHVSVLLR